MLTPSAAPGPGFTAAPIWPDAAERAALFAGLAAEPLLLAVSGGPDSMALLQIAAHWARGLAAPPAVHIACVDHGLRAGSAGEARLVARSAEALGLPSATLVWAGPKPATRLQERARAARYALLAEHARALGARCILTAHHADDQAETVLMRLTRGSGVAGLAGMARETPLGPDLRLVRPLLAVPKAALVAVCRREAQAFVDDPSNRDPAFARGRLRAEAAALARIGLGRDGLLRLARRMARAEKALEAATRRTEALLAPEQRPGSYRLDLARASDLEAEILIRLLHRAIAAVAAPGQTIRLERLEALAGAVAAARESGTRHRGTLGGTRIDLTATGTLRVTPEASRRRGRVTSS